MKTPIIYADSIGEYTLRRSMPKSAVHSFWGTFLPGQSASGYGARITTDLMLRFTGEKREYRVYATCYSNVASHWITRKGQRLFLHDTNIVTED